MLADTQPHQAPAESLQQQPDVPCDKPEARPSPEVSEPVGQRRSTRARVEPERLNIQSWAGQSYSAGVGHDVHQQQAGDDWYTGTYPANDVRWYGTTPPYQYFPMPPYLVGHLHGLHHSVAGGGGGITGYGLPSKQMQSIYQTKYWPTPSVQNTSQSLAQHSYPAVSGWY